MKYLCFVSLHHTQSVQSQLPVQRRAYILDTYNPLHQQAINRTPLACFSISCAGGSRSTRREPMQTNVQVNDSGCDTDIKNEQQKDFHIQYGWKQPKITTCRSTASVCLCLWKTNMLICDECDFRGTDTSVIHAFLNTLFFTTKGLDTL